MNPVALYLASGESLYVGALLLVMAALASPFLRARWMKRVRNMVAAIGACLFLLACAPFAWITYALFLVVFACWHIAWNRVAPSKFLRLARIASAAVCIVLVLALTASELSHRITHVFGEQRHFRLTVIGDSISAGIDSRHPPWPTVFQSKGGIPVNNLSRPGIGVPEAIPLLAKVMPEDTLILIELGGNDLLADLPAADFERALDQFLSSLVAPRRTLVMFELPLFPHKIACGRVQRRLAEKYHVYLLPKHLFIDVLAGADATSDGLHLSPAGADRMSALIDEILGPILFRPEGQAGG